MARAWKGIVIHCSASSWGTEKDIDYWHKGNGWLGTGYHFVIQNGHYNNHTFIKALDGQIEVGRNINKIGAHARGVNTTHLGICLIGTDEFSAYQILSLYGLVEDLVKRYKIPIQNIIAHSDIANKDCPNFDVGILREALELVDVSLAIDNIVGVQTEYIV